MNRFLLFLTVSTVFLLMAVPLYAQGNSGNAPGQAKNDDVHASSNRRSDAAVGPVENITSTSVTVDDKKTKTKKEGTIDANTRIIGQDRKLLKVGAIKLKGLIALISSDSATATAGGKLKLKKIFVKEASESAQMKRRAVQGVITAINGNVLTLAHQIQRDRTYTVLITPETIIKFKSQVSKGSEATPSPFASTSPIATASPTATSGAALAETTASSTSLAVGQRIVAMGDLNPDGGIIAKLIHIIPGKATGIFKRLPVSTPSASLKPSPTSTPSASSSPSATPVASP